MSWNSSGTEPPAPPAGPGPYPGEKGNALRPFLIILVAAILVGAVYVYATRGGSGSPVAEATPGPTATAPIETATDSAPTAPPWPARFADYFCTAVGQHSIFVEDLQAMQRAAEAVNLRKVSQHALSAQTDALVIRTAIEAAPKWAPAADTVQAWRAALLKLEPGLKHVRQAANRGDLKLMRQASREIAAGSKLLAKATPKAEAFIAETGFTC